MIHAAGCRRGWFDARGWHEGRAPRGHAQWHSAVCEGDGNIEYGRRMAIAQAPAGAESFMFDTIPSLEERAMRFGIAMAQWVKG